MTDWSQYARRVTPPPVVSADGTITFADGTKASTWDSVMRDIAWLYRDLPDSEDAREIS